MYSVSCFVERERSQSPCFMSTSNPLDATTSSTNKSVDGRALDVRRRGSGLRHVLEGREEKKSTS
jgi:hypothetical protein